MKVNSFSVPNATFTAVPADHVPESYDELFRTYYPYIVSLVARAGIERQTAEDVSMTILSKFVEHDALNDFDPNFVSEHGGVQRRAVFRTFLSGFVFSYVRHYVARQQITQNREVVSLDAPVVVDNEDRTMGAILMPEIVDTHDALMVKDLVESIRARLARTRPQSDREKCDLPALFDAVLAQVSAGERVNYSALALQFGVSPTSIQNWMARLRTQVSLATEAR